MSKPNLLIVGSFALGLVVGLGVGWLFGARVAPPAGGAWVAWEGQSPAGPASTLGESTVGGPGGGTPQALTPGGTPVADKPLGMPPRRIMSDIKAGLASGVLNANAVSLRLQLLAEAGAEGRNAMVEFLEENIDYPTSGKAISKSGGNSLRFDVINRLANSPNPEAVAALSDLLVTTPNLNEALLSLARLKRWDHPITPAQRASLLELGLEALDHVKDGGSIHDRASQLINIAVAARETGDLELQTLVEKGFAEHAVKTDKFTMIFASYNGELQQQCLQRIGVDSLLAKQIMASSNQSQMIDLRQPAVRQIFVNYVTDDRIHYQARLSAITSIHLLNLPTDAQFYGAHSNSSFSSAIGDYKDEAQREAHLHRLEAVESLLNGLQRHPALGTTLRNAVESRLAELPIVRQKVLEGTVRKSR